MKHDWKIIHVMTSGLVPKTYQRENLIFQWFFCAYGLFKNKQSVIVQVHTDTFIREYNQMKFTNACLAN